MQSTYLIGCGGIGSYLAYPLARTIKSAFAGQVRLVLVDGDTVTEGNLDRQQFETRDIGRMKAKTLGRKLEGALVLPAYLTPGFSWPAALEPQSGDFIICAADNHIARRTCLEEADNRTLTCIVAANEDVSAEAYVYRPNWAGHPVMDPRLRYPSILTDVSGDPVHAEGCTGEEALASAPQTAEANFVAAALALRLFGAWALKAPGMDRDFYKYLPYAYESNFSSVTTRSIESAEVREAA